MNTLAGLAPFAFGALVLAFAVYLTVREYWNVTAIDRAWGAFARARGFTFTPHRGAVWAHTSFGKRPHLRCVIDGLSVDVVPRKSFDLHDSEMSYAPLQWTLAYAPIARAHAGPLTDADLLPEAALIWSSLKQARPSVNLALRPDLGDARVVIVGWRALERDADILESALRLIAAAAKR
jgi:hypothetical protein